MHDNPDPELLQTLMAIADTGSFAAAAKNVHRTHSAVSMQMKRLEEINKQPLFEKHGRGSVLTSNGQNLLLVEAVLAVSVMSGNYACGASRCK